MEGLSRMATMAELKFATAASHVTLSLGVKSAPSPSFRSPQLPVCFCCDFHARSWVCVLVCCDGDSDCAAPESGWISGREERQVTVRTQVGPRWRSEEAELWRRRLSRVLGCARQSEMSGSAVWRTARQATENVYRMA
eukprot:2296543-Rhodomonas_salina.1